MDRETPMGNQELAGAPLIPAVSEEVSEDLEALVEEDLEVLEEEVALTEVALPVEADLPEEKEVLPEEEEVPQVEEADHPAVPE